jgi:aspartyl/asparaginyl beta-hydroxylase (cupin superfamily)
MVTSFFVVGGILFWLFFAFVLGLKVLRKALRPLGIGRRLQSPSLLPYAQWMRFRRDAYLWLVLRKLRLIRRDAVKQEVIDAHRTTSLAKMKALRDVTMEVDQLPTVVEGKRAMGIDSIFEFASKPAHTIKSPYTHPLQFPPYFIPGVPARMFYDESEFDWAAPLVEGYPVILEELRNVLAADGKGFKAYVSEQQHRLQGWNTFNFFFYGKKVEENCERCPRTTALLESLPRFERDHIMFSALNPHSHIPAHVGPINGIIRAHLGLNVPKGCYIKVGSEERTWENGKLLIFDDSFLHEVWNHSDEVRIVLFMNFWHPRFQSQEIPVLERYRAAYEQTPYSRVHNNNQRADRGHDLAGTTAVVAHA